MDDFAIRLIRATRHADGRVTVDDYPPLIGIADGFLASADGEYEEVEGDYVTFRAANGDATYRLVGRDAAGRITLAERIT